MALLQVSLSLWLHACDAPQDRDNPVANPSVVALLSVPDSFNGRTVRVVGILLVDFELSALFLGSDDAEARVFQNSIWVDLAGYTGPLEGLSGARVEVEGRFDATSHGHLGGWIGEIREVQSIRRYGPIR